MPKEDLTGKKFNMLTVLSLVEGTKDQWLCQCECGNQKIIYANRIKRGITKSCGCLEKANRQALKIKTTKHGMTNTVLYGKWCSMKERCYNPNYKYFYRYGGRGIVVCDEWLGENGFANFAKWAYGAGYDENKHDFQQTLDRKDTDGNYCPDNCKWSDQLEQVRNRSNAKLIEDLDGEKITSDEFSRKHNITAESFVYRRVLKNKTAKEILDEWNAYAEHNNGNYLSKIEASKYYGVCVGTVSNWIKSGRLKSVYIRNQYYIPKGQERPIFN